MTELEEPPIEMGWIGYISIRARVIAFIADFHSRHFAGVGCVLSQARNNGAFQDSQLLEAQTLFLMGVIWSISFISFSYPYDMNWKHCTCLTVKNIST